MAASQATSVMLAMLLATICLARSCEGATGRATYYTAPYVPSACYGYDTSNFLPNNFIVAANSGLYNGGAACGQTCQVSCSGAGCTSSQTISVRLVDLCPGCAGDQIDLSQEAFSAIANTDQGVITINYSCS